jgi:4-hydroxy-3-methylbut-2-enyl diphosphate reductase
MQKNKLPLKILLCNPRGFCAGVVRAIDVVKAALERYGPPVYVRHEIVHNRFVVDDLKARGAIFVRELDEVPAGNAPVIFSAHGVAKIIPEEAKRRNLFSIDATCPLVTKVHREAQIHYKRGRHIFLIGHKDHPEVIGTMGQLPQGAMTLVETIKDAAQVQPPPNAKLAYVTQTTLSLDDTAAIIAVLKKRFPDVFAPHKEDICYATTNRQEAVKKVAPLADAMIVVGAPNSSNSQRLVETAIQAGCKCTLLLQRAEDIEWPLYEKINTLGVTAGASAPEILVENIIQAFSLHFMISVEIISTADEKVFFPLPREIRKMPQATSA